MKDKQQNDERFENRFNNQPELPESFGLDEDEHSIVEKAGRPVEGYEDDEEAQYDSSAYRVTPVPARVRKIIQPPVPWTSQEPPFELSRQYGFYGMDHLHPTQIVHTLAIGGTGVGKSQSVVIPLTKSMLRLRVQDGNGESRHASMLIVDPKCELLDIVTREMDQELRIGDLVHLGISNRLPPLRFFDPEDGLTVRDKIEQLDAILQTELLSEDNHAYWHEAGKLVLTQILNLEEAYAKQYPGQSLIQLLSVKVLMTTTQNFWGDLTALLAHSRIQIGRLRYLDRALQCTLKAARMLGHGDATVLSQYTASSDEYTQWHYRLQSLHPMTSLLAEAAAAGVVDFDPFPSSDRETLVVRDLLDSGRVLFFQPEPVPSSEVIARALKAKVYESVKNRRDMERPVFIVIDEFQRFITADKVTGDAHFLDTARAYRANCVLATQSIGALHLALGSDNHARAAVEAIVANTPSKWFFASKDIATRETVKALIPKLPDSPHIVEVRPLAQLEPGQAYWSLADGRWGLDRAELDKLL